MKTTKLNPDIVLKIANQVLNTDVLLNLKTRRRDVVEPRQMAMYFLYAYTPLSFMEVGKMFKKNHATVVHARKTIPNLISFDSDLREKFTSIQKELTKSLPYIQEYGPDTKYKSIAEEISETKRLNSRLIHKVINLKQIIESLPEDVKLKYFKDGEYIHSA